MASNICISCVVVVEIKGVVTGAVVVVKVVMVVESVDDVGCAL